MAAFSQRSALCLTVLLALSVVGAFAQSPNFVKPPVFGAPPGCPVFLFTTGVFCPPEFVNSNDECATALDCGEGELCCSGPSCASPKFCSEPLCSPSKCFGFSGAVPQTQCPDGSVLESSCAVNQETGLCTEVLPECPPGEDVECHQTIPFDLNKSCELEVQDIIIMVGFVLSVQPNECDLQAADANNDSVVSVNDVASALACLVNGTGSGCALTCE